eukprot:1324947-Lingulodinium_polyedra.AAC.1
MPKRIVRVAPFSVAACSITAADSPYWHWRAKQSVSNAAFNDGLLEASRDERAISALTSTSRMAPSSPESALRPTFLQSSSCNSAVWDFVP